MRILSILSIFFISKFALAKEPYDWQLGFQKPSSDVMRSVLELHDFVLIMMTAITIFVLALILYVVFRFRRNVNPNPSKRSHNTFIEILWTGIPVIILIVSVACIIPIIPGSTPITPASAHDGTISGGGGSGIKSL